MKSPTSFSLYRCPVIETGALSAWREAFVAHAFPEASLPSHEVVMGWCSPEDPGKPWDPYACTVGDVLVVGLRVDLKSIPGALLALEVDRRCASWCAEHSRERVPGTVKREIKEAAREDLVLKVPAVPHHAVVVIHADGEACVTGDGQATKRLADHWRRTVGTLIPEPDLRPLSLAHRIEQHLDGAQLSHLIGYDAGDEDRANPSLRVGNGAAFLAWLWHRSETAGHEIAYAGRPDAQVSWVAEEQVHVADGESRKRRLSVRAASAAEDPAIRTSLLGGHVLEGLSFRLQHRDGPTIGGVRLSVDTGDVQIAAVTLPKGVEASPVDKAIEHQAGLTQLHSAVAELLLAWTTGAGSADSIAQHESSMQQWLVGDLSEWMDRHGGAR